MAYISKQLHIGDWGYTTRKIESDAGYFEAGTKVQIVNYDEQFRYDIEDEFGNTIYQCSTDSVKPINGN